MVITECFAGFILGKTHYVECYGKSSPAVNNGPNSCLKFLHLLENQLVYSLAVQALVITV